MSQSPAPRQHAPHGVSLIETPPHTLGGILRRLGPGLIIAGSIVGSGELIATTKTGAEAGYALLWLIVIGCIIKIFVQLELGRFAVSQGIGTMEALNLVPGPRLRASWLVWCWLAMFLASAFMQLGGILGGVGQALAMSVPLRGDFVEKLQAQDDYAARRQQLLDQYRSESADDEIPVQQLRQIVAEVDAQLGPKPSAYTWDDVIWSAIVAAITSILLVNGRYGLVQRVATVLVAAFTAVTILNVCALPYFSEAEIGWRPILRGLMFELPEARPGASMTPLAVAFATFGIIGVGASELIAYPYWCLEKGYARFTGPRDDSPEWAERARGWLRVMRWDAWCSLVVYTFATVCFYILGAAVLHPRGLSPSGNEMIRTLATMYEDVFGTWGEIVFLGGAIAVLYSTVFVATAGNTRMAADGIRVFRLGAATEETRRWWIRFLCGVMPFVNLTIYMLHKNPVQAVLLAGLAQAVMLPLLGGAALYFRYYRGDPRIASGWLFDWMLWISVVGLAIAGIWGVVETIPGLLRPL